MATRNAEKNAQAVERIELIHERALAHKRRTKGLHVSYAPGLSNAIVELTWPAQKGRKRADAQIAVLEMVVSKKTAKVSATFIIDSGNDRPVSIAVGLTGKRLRSEIHSLAQRAGLESTIADSAVAFLDSLVPNPSMDWPKEAGPGAKPTKAGRKYPAVTDLADVITQVVQFGLDDFQGDGKVPEQAVFNISYIVSCFLAQHTVNGINGVPTEEAMEGMKLPHFMPYTERLELAKALIADLGGVK